jgi:hypothetical protein
MTSGEVAAKLDRVRGWLAGSGYGAALFSSQPGVSWVTGGLEDRVVRNEEPALVWALVTETAAFLITTNIEQPRMTAEESPTAFELHAVPWYSAGGLGWRWVDVLRAGQAAYRDAGFGPLRTCRVRQQRRELAGHCGRAAGHLAHLTPLIPGRRQGAWKVPRHD